MRPGGGLGGPAARAAAALPRLVVIACRARVRRAAACRGDMPPPATHRCTERGLTFNPLAAAATSGRAGSRAEAPKAAISCARRSPSSAPAGLTAGDEREHAFPQPGAASFAFVEAGKLRAAAAGVRQPHSPAGRRLPGAGAGLGGRGHPRQRDVLETARAAGAVGAHPGGPSSNRRVASRPLQPRRVRYLACSASSAYRTGLYAPGPRPSLAGSPGQAASGGSMLSAAYPTMSVLDTTSGQALARPASSLLCPVVRIWRRIATRALAIIAWNQYG